MISQRAQNVQPSATLKVTGRAKELKREGKSIVSLSAGEPDFKPQNIYAMQPSMRLMVVSMGIL